MMDTASSIGHQSANRSTCVTAEARGQDLNCSTQPLNFSTVPEENDLHGLKKPKIPRDPMSHRIIEKRRRDRMNNCLADLSRLIPTSYTKQGQGRIEKTEIIEMAIRHIKQLKAKIEVQEVSSAESECMEELGRSTLQKPCCLEKFYMGFKECEAELMRFLVENEGWDAKDQLCSRLMNQLDEASKKFTGNFDQELKKETDYYQQARMFTSDDMTSDLYRSATPSSQCDSGEFRDAVSVKSSNTVDNYNIVRDRHLRTLLSKNSRPSSAENESGIGSSSASQEPLIESCDKSPNNNRDYDRNARSSPRCSEDSASSSCSSSRHRQDQDSAAYKFKHNITLRFSRERKVGGESDSSSYSSLEGNDVLKVRRKMLKTKAACPNSDSSVYPTSECSSHDNSSNGGFNSSGSGKSNSRRADHGKDQLKLNGSSLPGFLLHPLGTFYMPISLTPAQVSSLGVFTLPDSAQHQMLHPISIPVNFGGHFISMRNINVQSPSFSRCSEKFSTDPGCQQMDMCMADSKL